MLEKEGFEVSIWESPMDKVMKLPAEERGGYRNVYAAKESYN